MAIIGDTITKVTGGTNLSAIGSGLLQGVTIIFGVIAIAVIAAVFGWIYWNKKRYSKKIIIVKKIGGASMIAGEDRGRVIKIGDMGNEILYLQKMKVFRATKGLQVKKDTYLFTIDEEGNWLNVGLSDISKDLRKLNYEIPSNDARMANVSIRRLNEKQFEKDNWLKQNIGLVVGGMILVVIVIFMWLMAAKYFTIFNTQKDILTEYKIAQQQNTETVQAMTSLANSIDKIVNGHSASFTPVNISTVVGT